MFWLKISALDATVTAGNCREVFKVTQCLTIAAQTQQSSFFPPGEWDFIDTVLVEHM